MLRRSRTAIGAIVAALAVAAIAATPAFADVSVSLQVSRSTAVYDQEFVLRPTVTGTQTIPGDKIVLEAWSSTESTWTPFGEGSAIEDTDTVEPMYMVVDDSFLPWCANGAWTATTFRATYKPTSRGKDASGTALPAPPSVKSNTPSLKVVKHRTVRTKSTVAKSAKRFRKVALTGWASPNSGVGTMRFTISKPGRKTVVLNVKTEDDGCAVTTYKFPARGKFKVSARWLGSQFGAASKSAVTKYVTVR